MDLDAILFTVIECLVIFALVYFFFSNVKIRGVKLEIGIYHYLVDYSI